MTDDINFSEFKRMWRNLCDVEDELDQLRTELEKAKKDRADADDRWWNECDNKDDEIHQLRTELENERQGHNECMEGYDRLRQALVEARTNLEYASSPPNEEFVNVAYAIICYALKGGE